MIVISLDRCWSSARVPQSQFLKSCKVRGKRRKGGEEDDKGIVSDTEGVRSLGGREMSRSMRYRICAFVAVVVLVVVVVVVLILAMREVVLMVALEIMVLVGVVGVLRIGALEVDCAGVVGILLLGGVSVAEVAEGVELVVGCVVRVALWCMNRKGHICGRFTLKSVEMKGLSLGGLLFGMMIRVDCFVLLEWGFLTKIIGTDVLMNLVVEVVMVAAVDVVQAGFFIFF